MEINKPDVQISQNKNDTVSNDTSSLTSNENFLREVNDKINDKNKNEFQRDIQNGINSFKNSTYSKTNKLMQSESEIKNAKSSVSHSDGKNTINILMDDNSNITSNSSSGEDILQTRYSVTNKHCFETIDNSNHSISHLSEKTSDKEDTFENNLNTKTSPIIIQAIAYDEKRDTVDNKQITERKKQEEIKNVKERNNETTSINSLSAEASSSFTDIESKCAQISNENCNEELDFNSYLKKAGTNEGLLQQMMKNITVIAEQDSAGKELEKSKAVNDDFVVEDFLNGSFDVATYKLKDHRNSEFSNTEQFENNELKSTVQTKAKKTFNTNRHNKRQIKETVTANKRVKQSNSSYNKREILTTGFKEKKLDSKQMKRTMRETRAKKSNKKFMEKKSGEHGKLNLKVYPKSNKKLSNTTQLGHQINNKFNKEDQDMDFYDITNDLYETKQMKPKSFQRENEDNVVFDAHKDSFQNKYSGRKLRSSSLMASKKIKEIEKLENLTNFDEIIIDSGKEIVESDEEIKIDTDNEWMDLDKEQNYITPFNFKRNSNILDTKKACSNRIKVKYENKKANVTNKLQSENVVEERDDHIDIVHYSQRNNIGSIKPSRYKTQNLGNKFTNPIKTYDLSKKSPVKKGRYEIQSSKNQTSDLSLFNQYFIDENDNLCKNTQSLEKGRKGDNDARNSDVILDSSCYSMSNIVPKKNVNNFTSSTGYTKESKHRSWEMLEKELLEDLDNEQLANNVCKTVILKEEEVVTKKEVVKDRNLLTVSNISMLKTISKSKTGNKYNLQCEIKNTESKFLGAKDDTPYNFRNSFKIQQMKEVEPRSFKNTNILDKTIAAMEKCSAKFLAPKVNLCDTEQEASSWQPENFSDNSDVHQEAQFHSHTTFMAHDNKQYYSNKIFGFMKKSNEESINIKKKSSIRSNLSDHQRKGDNENYEDALHSEHSLTLNKNNLLKECAQKSSYHEGTQALVPCCKEKNNPWDKLMKKLHLQEDYEECSQPVTSLSKNEKNEQISESLSIIKNLNNSKRNTKMLAQIDYKEDEIKLDKDTMMEQEVHKDLKEGTELLVSHSSETKNLSFIDNLTLGSAGLKSDIDKDKNVEENYESEKRSRKLENDVKKINDKNKVAEKQILKAIEDTNVMKSPRYKLKLDTDGAFKLRKHSFGDEASSSTKSSEDFIWSKKIDSQEAKDNANSKPKTNKTREKYKKYLKNMFDEKDSLVINEFEDETKSKEDKSIQDKKNLGEPLDECKNNIRNTKKGLMAEKDDDIFSLSSSDEASEL